jgi:peptidoglycan/xylan/chitin deacetylase (PgdA/CDA1 family)
MAGERCEQAEAILSRLSPPPWLDRWAVTRSGKAAALARLSGVVHDPTGVEVNRRAFLGRAAVGMVGLATGGAALDLDRRSDTRSREADDSAGPDGWPRSLGQRRLVWSVPTTLPLVALTFDDGPDPDLTPGVLEALAAHGAKATFNMMGWSAGRRPDLVRAVVDAGHELGNHTWTHRDLAGQSASQTRRELDRGRCAIEAAGGVRPRWFRPPRGNLTGAALCAASELGQDVLLWSIDRGPAGVGTPAAVADHLSRVVGPGDVVGLHDGIGRGTFDPDGTVARYLRARRLVELAALPTALRRLQDQGLRLVTASELVAAVAQARV